MNFLSHLYLSDDDEGLIIGNFIADGIKGNKFETYDIPIRNGILLHRFIDSYTDSHPFVKHSKSILFQNYRHYSGVIVDIFYDHFLAFHWNQHSKITLEEYSKHVLSILHNNIDILPDESKNFLRYLVKYDRLAGYKNIDIIAKVLGEMSRRMIFESKMEKAVNDLLLHYEDFENDFNKFFPELVLAVHNYKISNKI